VKKEDEKKEDEKKEDKKKENEKEDEKKEDKKEEDKKEEGEREGGREGLKSRRTCSVDLRCREVGDSPTRRVGESSTYAKIPEKLEPILFFSIASSVQENFFSVFSITSYAGKLFSIFLSLHRCRKTFFGFFYRFIGAGKLFSVFFYRFIRFRKTFFWFFLSLHRCRKTFSRFFYCFICEKNVAQQNSIALFDFFLKNCVSVLSREPQKVESPSAAGLLPHTHSAGPVVSDLHSQI
jgi:hypothetical protein